MVVYNESHNIKHKLMFFSILGYDFLLLFYKIFYFLEMFRIFFQCRYVIVASLFCRAALDAIESGSGDS